MTNECEVYFILHGKNFDPNVISTTLDIEPTKIKKKSDPGSNGSSWMLSVGKIESEFIDVYEIASKLIGKLIPHTSKIINAINTYDLGATLQVVLWISMDESISTPVIGFEPDSIQFLSAIGANIDIDTYKN